MRGVDRFVAAAAAVFIAVGGSLATYPAEAAVTRDNITVNVVAVPSVFPATVVGSEQRYGAYLVTITNNTSSTLNNARFRAELTTGGEWDSANPVQQDAARCVRETPTTIDCSVGYSNLILKDASVSFSVLLKTPTSGSVSLVWNVRPGDGYASNFITGSETTSLAADTSTGDKAKVETVVPPENLYSLYTGNKNQPRANDRHTTASTVKPAANTLVFASITESLGSAYVGTGETSICNLSTSKFCSKLSVDTDAGKAEYPSTLADKLVITIRIDATQLASGINSVKVYYTPDGQADGWYVPACPRKSTGEYIPTGTDPSPCVYSRIVYSKKLASDPDFSELAGDGEIVLFANKNGMIEVE